MRNSLSRRKAPTGTPSICKPKPPVGWPDPPPMQNIVQISLDWGLGPPLIDHRHALLQLQRVADLPTWQAEADQDGAHWEAHLWYAARYALFELQINAAITATRSIIATATPFKLFGEPPPSVNLDFYWIVPPYDSLQGIIPTGP